MSLFNRKNKEEKTLACACNAGCPTSEVTETKLEKECCGKTVDGICCIKVLGSGCKSCHALLEAAQEAVHSMGLTIEVEYITDMEKIMQYGVMSMPALVVNEQVASMGKVLKAKKVETLLKKLIWQTQPSQSTASKWASPTVDSPVCPCWWVIKGRQQKSAAALSHNRRKGDFP